MKQNNHLLDDFLRSQVEDADLSYKEEYWEKMSSILDEEEKKKRFPFFWRGLSVFLVLLAIGIGAYLSPLFKDKSDKKKGKEIQTEQKNLLSVNQDLPNTSNQNANNQNSDQSNNTSQSSNDVDDNQLENQNETKNSNSQINVNQNNIESSNQELNQGSVTKANPNAKESTSESLSDSKNEDINRVNSQLKSKTIKRKKEDRISSSTVNSKKENIKANDLTKSESSNRSYDDLPSKNAIPNEIVKSKKKGKSSLNKIEQSTIAASTKVETQDTYTDRNSNQINDAQNVSVQGKVMKPIDTIQYTKSTPKDPSQNNPRYIASLSNYIPERLDSITVISYLPVEKKEVQSELSPKIDLPKSAEKRPFVLNMLAGVYANKAFAGNVSNSIAWGLSPYLGVGADKQFAKKLTLSSHVGFTYFNGLNSEISIESKQYGFGLDSTRFSVAHKKLLQLYLPVSVYYEVLKNHYLMFALGASYNLDVSSKVTESVSASSNSIGSNSKSASISSSTQSGYSTGFNRFDVFAQIGYSYQLFNKLMVQLTYQQGFVDMTKNAYFKNSLTNTQSRISIGLKYNFKRN